MSRYLVERSLPVDLETFLLEHPLGAIVGANTDTGVFWLHSYVAQDGRRMLCLYEASGPEAIRKAARRAGLPIEVIHQVSVLDPASFHEIRRNPS